MKINNVEVVGNKFAYDGCHKIYIIEDMEDEQKAIDCGYEIFNISELVDRIEIVASLDLYEIGSLISYMLGSMNMQHLKIMGKHLNLQMNLTMMMNGIRRNCKWLQKQNLELTVNRIRLIQR